MAKVKGKVEYEKFKKGNRLTRKQAILAQCYVCNGEGGEGGVDCKGIDSCPLYQYFPYKHKKGLANEI